jgi:integrase
MSLPRYVTLAQAAEGITKYRYNPPQDAVDAGVVARCVLGTEKDKAFALAEELNAQLDNWRKELRYLKDISEDTRVHELIKAYKNNITFTKLSIKAQRDYLYYLQGWKDSKANGVALYQCKLGSLVTPHCQKIYETHAEHSVSLANHTLAVYRLLFNFAIRHGYITHNPFSKVLRRADKPRRTVWSREDVRAFMNTAYSTFKWRNVGLIVQMAYEYGQRMGDMRKLKWEQVDLEKGVLHLEQSKRRSRVTIPTSQGLLTMLRQQHAEFGWQQYIAPSNVPDRKGGLLPYSLFNLSRVAKQILADASLPSDLVLQDLRRTAITEMIEVGVPITNIMSVSGHATPQSLTPYIKNTLRSATVTQEMRGLT